MNKPLLVFATLLEANSALQKFHAKQIKPNLYESDKFDFLITGMGVAKTMQSLALAPSYKLVINIGFCGALKDFRFGDIFEVTKVGKHQEISFHLTSQGHFASASLITYDFPVHDQTLRQLLAVDYDLVDMEGWGIATVCSSKKTPYRLLKIVSDFCSTTTSQEIQEKGGELSELIASSSIFHEISN